LSAVELDICESWCPDANFLVGHELREFRAAKQLRGREWTAHFKAATLSESALRDIIKFNSQQDVD